jgi:hypothetical protein
MSNNDGTLFYRNMRGFHDGNEAIQMSEYPLYSDSLFTGECRSNNSPYQFLNLLPYPSNNNSVDEAILLRISWHVGNEHVNGVKTNNKNYHGGWATDEIAALASLRLGVRLKAGGATRYFRGTDPLGTPQATGKKRPEIFFRNDRAILPCVKKKEVDISRLKDIYDLKNLSLNEYIALVRAARQYQDAVWIAESEPELSWLMLVSAIETAANEWAAKMVLPKERLKISKPKLYDMLMESGGDELVEKVAEEIAPTLAATNKFKNFCLEFFPNPPDIRPSNFCQVQWDISGMKGVLDKIYRYRSIALHAGTPFPAPLCMPPEICREAGVPSENGGNSLAIHVLGGSWSREDTPMTLNAFCIFVEGVLNNWWDRSVKKSN